MNAHHRRTRIIDVPTRVDQVPLARQAIVHTLASWGLSDDSEAVYAVRLAASELLTNVVLHAFEVTAETRIVVELINGDWIRMGVHDGHPGCAALANVDTDATSGRGLKIVHDIVTGLNGVVFTELAHGGGKAVWVELPCDTDGQAPAMEGGGMPQPQAVRS